MKVIKHTSFSTVTEFFDETSFLDRIFLFKAIPKMEKQEMEKMKNAF